MTCTQTNQAKADLVLGLGKSGVAAAKSLLAMGREVCIYAGDKTEASSALAEPLARAGARVVFDSQEVEGSYGLCVVCPGIPQTGGFYQSALAASEELMSEPELAWREYGEDFGWVGITGTNGKTTTTSLITHLLNACGRKAFSCGNIGDTCLETAQNASKGDTLVAELSSYQLASSSQLACAVAVLLNITPDHLSWHGGFENYAQAKLRIFEGGFAAFGHTAVICSEVPEEFDPTAGLRELGKRVVRVRESVGDDCAFVDEEGRLVVRIDGEDHPLCSATDLQIKGAHNVTNALAGASAAIAYGCDPEAVAQALPAFAPIEHRIEPAGQVGGVDYYNDSKATNVDATLVALTAFPGKPIVLLLGGRDKGTDLAPLVEACKGPVRAIVTYGEGGPRFAQAFEGSGIQQFEAPGMREAFAVASREAAEGEVVLLSPACASFDEFNSFNHRGEVFKELVRELKGDRS